VLVEIEVLRIICSNSFIFIVFLIETSMDVYYHVLDVNVMGATVCLREFVKYMEGRKTPAHIINIGRYWT